MDCWVLRLAWSIQSVPEQPGTQCDLVSKINKQTNTKKPKILNIKNLTSLFLKIWNPTTLLNTCCINTTVYASISNVNSSKFPARNNCSHLSSQHFLGRRIVTVLDQPGQTNKQTDPYLRKPKEILMPCTVSTSQTNLVLNLKLLALRNQTIGVISILMSL